MPIIVTPANPISGVTLNNGDVAVVLTGGVAIATTLESGSEMTVSSGGVASLTTLSGGFETVSAGGVVSGTVVRGGTEAISSGGVASFSVISGNGSEAVYAGGSAMSAVLSGGLQAVYSGGMASGTVVSNGGDEFVYAGGVVSGTTLSSGGTLSVNSAGSAVFATVSNGGSAVVLAGGVASFTVVSSGGFQAVSGGVAQSTVVSGGGTEIVVLGGVASGTSVSGLFATQIVSSGGTARGTVVEGTFAAENVSAVGLAISTTIRDGFMHVSSGGRASFTVVSNGFAIVSRGGTAVSTTVAGGFEQVFIGGVASFTTVLSGFQQIYPGGVASGTTLSNGFQQVRSGGSAYSTVVSGGSQQVDGVASGTILDGGFETVTSGGIVSGTVVHGGVQQVFSGGLASGTVLSGGAEQVLSGGIVRATVVNSGATQSVSFSGVASGTTVRAHGFEVVSSGGTVSGTIVNGAGTLVVWPGGSAGFIQVSSGGSIDFPSLVFSGGSAVIGGTDILTVTEDGTSVTVQLEGSYMSKTFQTAKDSGTGTVVTLQISPRTLVWTGAQDSNFANAADWNDVTDGQNPALSPPSGPDTAQFLTGGGTISGTGTATALQFGGPIAWSVNSSASLSATGGVTVGQSGSGTLLVSGGSSIDGLGASDDISGSAGGVASVTVTGAGSQWQSAGELVVGNLGAGNLNITNSAGVSAAAAGLLPAMALGVGGGSSGSLTVTGAGSHASLVGQLDVGQAGGGTLTVGNLGTVQTGNDAALDPSEGFDIAQAAGGSGVANVTGAKSLLNNVGRFIVGDAGLGSLSIAAGATVDTTPGSVPGLAGLVIANTASASGASVNVTGAGSDLAITGTAVVGDAGSGALSVSQGATVTAGALDLAAGATGDGVVSVVGVGSSLTVTGPLIVGDQAAGEFSVLGGAHVTIGGGLVGGTGASAAGNLDIEGAGSVFTINAGSLVVGATGPAEFTLGIGATLKGQLATDQFGVTNLYGNVDPQTDPVDGIQNVGFNNSLVYDFYVDNSGTINVESETATFYTPLATFETNAANGSTTGVWQIGAKDTLVMNATSVDSSQTFDLTSTVAATLVIGQVPEGDINNLDTLNGMTTPTLTGSIAAGAANVLPGWAAPIENYQSGDVIILRGLTYASATASGDVVTMWDGVGGTGNALGSLTFIDKSGSTTSVAALAEATAAAAQINTLACFAAGTRIATESGWVAVEELRVGDRVVTVDGRCEPIVWVGHRAVDCARHPKPETVWPVRIKTGAFGKNVPSTELHLSPDHAIYCDGVLVPAKLLVNGTSITQVRRRFVVYHHVELEHHDVVLAEGLAAETYLDTGDRAKFSGERVTTLHPDFTARTWEMASAAPLIVTGGKLNAVRQRLNALASPTNDAMSVA